MSYEVIKTIRGRRYRYRQETYREGGKVKTRSIYLGPVDAPRKRKKGGGFPAFNPFAILLEGIALAAHIAKHSTRSPSYRVKNRPPDPRSVKHMVERERQKWALRIDAAKGFGRSKAGVRQEERWQAFMDRVTASQTAQDGPGRTQEAPAKNFTVDDEIEAREAKFEAAVDEYNAGTTAAPDSPAPADAPSPSGPGEP